MERVTLIVAATAGAIVGWLLTKILKRTGLGSIGDIVIGVLGGLAGAWLWDRLPLFPEVGPALLRQTFCAAAGALVLLVLARVVALR